MLILVGLCKTNFRWLQRSKVSTFLRILSDPDLSFMTAYNLIGNDTDSRWSMSMLIFDSDGGKPQVVKKMDPSFPPKWRWKQ
jgi:hypothetical protein